MHCVVSHGFTDLINHQDFQEIIRSDVSIIQMCLLCSIETRCAHMTMCNGGGITAEPLTNGTKQSVLIS